MANNAEDAFKKIEGRLSTALRELPAIIGEEAVGFYLNSFEQGAWSGEHQQPWKKRKNPTKWGKADETDRALLVKTGTLKRSIRVTRILNDRVFVGAGGPDVPYAKVHNTGFRGVVRQEVRPFTRRLRNGKRAKVKGFNRTIHQNIPKRQYIGTDKESPYLRNRIRRACIVELKKVMK